MHKSPYVRHVEKIVLCIVLHSTIVHSSIASHSSVYDISLTYILSGSVLEHSMPHIRKRLLKPEKQPWQCALRQCAKAKKRAGTARRVSQHLKILFFFLKGTQTSFEFQEFTS